jgi:hypothetical protein
MGNYERSTEVGVAADELFAYLADVENLPDYLPRITDVEPAGGDRVEVTAQVDADQDGNDEQVGATAWFEADDASRTVRWGSPGPNDYEGELEVAELDDRSRVTVRLRTERVEGPDVGLGLDEAV